MDCNKVFAQRIKELREKHGLSQRELAAILGIGNSSISQYENCLRRADIETAKKFADYFNVTLDYLIGLTDYPHKK